MKTIYYFHIPKTGGQTLALRLASGFPGDRIDVLGPSLRFPKDLGTLRNLIEDNHFVERHSSGSMLRALDNVDILTTIREPVAQIASHYLHILREPQSEMHRAANSLSMKEFISTFGDLLANFQARCLFSGFCTPKEYKSIDWTRPRTWCDKLYRVLEMVRWVVPTEVIDEFVSLWRLEMRRQAPYDSTRRNVALKDNLYAELLELIRDRGDLYFADSLLWQCARRHYADYKEQLLRTLTPIADSADASRAYWDGSSGIWLLKGWHFPETNGGDERHWWAGGDSYSEIAFVRKKVDRFLHFDVGIFCGISHKDIWATTGDGRQIVPLIKEKRGKVWSYWIDLRDQPMEGSLIVRVPHVLAPILVDPQSDDTRRLSFAAQGWAIVATAPGKRVRTPVVVAPS